MFSHSLLVKAPFERPIYTLAVQTYYRIHYTTHNHIRPSEIFVRFKCNAMKLNIRVHSSVYP